jgi:glycosyltransferase involved in cell wall biosynthesis
MVKNEAHIIERCLRSAAKVLKEFIIVDTGSTDETVDIAKKVTGELHLGMSFHYTDWKDFGQNRSEALQIARDWLFDYAVIIDADDELTGSLPKELTADGYSISVTSGSTTFMQTRILNLSKPWKYVGAIHEYPTCKDVGEWIYTDAIKIKTNNDGSSWKDAQKYRKHALELWREHIEDPTNARTVFYLAQSFRDAKEQDMAERFYKKRIEMGGWFGEIWFSKYWLGKLENSKGNLAKATEWFLDAYETDTRRAEPLYELLKMYRAIGKFSTAYLFGCEALDKEIPEDALFPIQSNYKIDLWEELALCAYSLKENQVAIMLWNWILNEDISSETKLRINKNISAAMTN